MKESGSDVMKGSIYHIKEFGITEGLEWGIIFVNVGPFLFHPLYTRCRVTDQAVSRYTQQSQHGVIAAASYMFPFVCAIPGICKLVHRVPWEFSR